MTAVPPPPVGQPMPLPAPVVAPRPVQGLGTAAAALLAVGGLAALPVFLSSWTDYFALADHVNGGASEQAYWEHYRGQLGTQLLLTALCVPAFLAATVTLLMWLHRARVNAGLLSPQYPFRYSPAFSVGGWLVPFANLWWSRPILEDIAAGSSPVGRADRGVRLVRSWWIVIIVGTVVSLVGSALTPVSTLTYTPNGQLQSGGADALSSFLGVALTNTLLCAFAVVSFVQLAMIIRHVTRLQTAVLFPPRPA